MKLSIVTKNILLFSAVIAVFMGATYYQLSQMRQSTKTLYALNMGYIPLSKIIDRTDTIIKKLESDVERILNLDTNDGKKLLARTVVGYFPRLFNQYVAQGVAHCDKLLLVTKLSEQQKFYADMKDKLLLLSKQHKEFQKVAKAYSIYVPEGEVDESRKMMDKIKRQERRVLRTVKILSIKMEKQFSLSIEQAEQKASKANWAGIVLSLCAFLVALILTITSAFLLKPIGRLKDAAQKIGQGEYRINVAINRNDELGMLADEFEKMRLSLIGRDKSLKDQADKLELSNLEFKNLKIHYENIIKNLSLPVMVADTNQVLITINPEAANIWGDRIYDKLGGSVSALPLDEGVLGEIIDFDLVLKDRSKIVSEAVKIKNTKGELRRVTITVVPFLDDNKVRGLMIIGEDVTDELRLKESLIETERMAAIGPFSRAVVHEIRNPLSSIGLNSEMLQEELESETPNISEMQPLMTSIITEVDRLHHITDNYQKFAKSPSSKRADVDVNGIISSLADFYRAEMNSRNIKGKLSLSSESIIVSADENEIVRVFHNLIKNAIEAMPDGGVLEISTKVEKSQCLISIKDSGHGIPEKIATKIFDPYFTTKENGSGLGLMLAKQVVLDLGGKIVYESPPDSGALFKIYIRTKSQVKDGVT